MKSAIIPLLFVSLLVTARAAAAPAPPTPTGPSPEAARQIEARRKALAPFELVDLERLSDTERAETLRTMGPALKDLETALASRDQFIFNEAVRDLVNGNYRGFPKDRILGLLLPRLKAPETTLERMPSQGFIMEYLARRYGSQAKGVLPDLLAMVTNDKVPTYLRGKAIEAAANIAPGDEAVVKALIEALNNPNPKSESGVHDRAAGWLGEMGPAAASAKPALLKLMDRGAWYEDGAFMALGKIGGDETLKPLVDYLDLLGKLDKISVEQAAAVFHDVLEVGKKGKQQPEGAAIDPEVAKAARPVMLKIVEDRKDDMFSRAALRALRDFGPGAGPRAAKAITLVLVRDHSPLAVEVLRRLEPTDTEAVVPLTEAFARASAGDDWYTPQVVAEALVRYGKAARPAAPAIIKALRKFRTSADPGIVYGEQFAAYLAVLAGIGGDEPGVRRVVIDLLDPTGDVLKKTGPNAPEYQLHLLITLAKLGLPPDGEDRPLALTRVRDGLASDLAPVFCAAAKVVIAGKPLRVEEAKPLVPLLARVLAPDYKFKEAHARISPRLRGPFSAEEFALSGVGLSARALGSLGPTGRDALPALTVIADRKLEKRKSDFLPDAPMNAVILEARKAVGAIR
jgi:hypothetical protein